MGAIVGARLGQFDCFLGDCVILRSEGTAPAWVAIIDKFVAGEDGEKAASFVWFSNEKEIRNKAKKRTDSLHVCGPVPSSGFFRDKSG
jgi:origin recognition complex subunit 1